MDKHLILNRIKKAYNLSGNSDLARFLGVTPGTITNWYNRNSIDYDLIFTKCKNLDLEWLLTGKGDMTKKEESGFSNLTGNIIAGNQQRVSNVDMKYGVEQITADEKEVEILRNEIARLNEALKEKEDIIKEKERIIMEEKERLIQILLKK